MTQDVGGRPRFLGLPTYQDLLTPGREPLAYAALPRDRPIQLFPRINKAGDPQSLGSIFQAQSNGMALVDQKGRAVYSMIHVNQKYYDFVRSNRLYDPAVYGAVSPTMNFPNGCVTIKSTWRVLAQGEAGDGFYATDAEVPLLTTQDGKVVIDPSMTRTERVAMVGIHVVGRVEGHPEFIWGTFEHNANAPELAEGGNPSSTDPVSNRDWTFYRANTPARDCNLSNAGNLTLVDPGAQTLSPIVNVFRQFAQGGGSDSNRAEIRELNGSVHDQIRATEPTSPWLNYDLIGSVWTTGNLQPDQFIRIADSRGSVRLSNSTMETTFQRQQNCFSCHDTRHVNQQGMSLGGKNLNTSHILRDNFFHAAEFANAALAVQQPQQQQPQKQTPEPPASPRR